MPDKTAQEIVDDMERATGMNVIPFNCNIGPARPADAPLGETLGRPQVHGELKSCRPPACASLGATPSAAPMNVICAAQCASGSGRTWICTARGLLPLPPSFSQGVRSPFVLHRPRPFQPAFGSSTRPSRPLAKKPSG